MIIYEVTGLPSIGCGEGRYFYATKTEAIKAAKDAGHGATVRRLTLAKLPKRLLVLACLYQDGFCATSEDMVTYHGPGAGEKDG